jgi:hypothetical protein
VLSVSRTAKSVKSKNLYPMAYSLTPKELVMWRFAKSKEQIVTQNVAICSLKNVSLTKTENGKNCKAIFTIFRHLR